MSKAWKITTIIISSILGLILVFLGIYYLWPWNKSFFEMASKEFLIPGLDTNFAPQGITAIDGEENRFLISGYMSDGKASRFYVINEGKIEKYFTLTQSEEDYTGHAGGIVSKGSTIWVVGDGNCYRFFLTDVNKAENEGKIEIIDSFETCNGADFVFENGGYLWVGEFYKEGKYETDQSHRLKTRSGEINPALVFGYKIDESYSMGIVSNGPTPDKVLSIRGLCQGIAVSSSGNIIMSTSYGLPDSNLYIYKDVLNEERHSTFILGKHILDLWYLDQESLINQVNAPAMSEELVVKNNKVYILFESSAKKYKIFNRKPLKNVYSINLDSLYKK